MFDIRSTAPNPVDFLWTGNENKVLVDDINYNALASRFSAVKFHANASDFYGWQRITSELSSPVAGKIVI